MTDQDRKAKSGGGKEEDEAALWAAAVADVEPLEGRAHPAAGPPAGPAAEPSAPSAPSAPKRDRPPAPAARKTGAGGGLDRRSAERLRRGKMPIEASLDLHGRSRQQAYEALRGFIRDSHRAGRRCVLVVTGKGRGGEGVLRAALPAWLAAADLRDLILTSVPAQPRHGGGGAFYVLLRRKR